MNWQVDSLATMHTGDISIIQYKEKGYISLKVLNVNLLSFITEVVKLRTPQYNGEISIIESGLKFLLLV
jgi:hypothetical protein